MVIDAAPKTTYGIIADNQNGHPGILPPEHFRSLTVERGGRGAGAVIRYEKELRLRNAAATVAAMRAPVG